MIKRCSTVQIYNSVELKANSHLKLEKTNKMKGVVVVMGEEEEEEEKEEEKNKKKRS